MPGFPDQSFPRHVRASNLGIVPIVGLGSANAMIQWAIKMGISVLSTMRSVLPPKSISVSWLWL